MDDKDVVRCISGLNFILALNGIRLFAQKRLTKVLIVIYWILATLKRCHFVFWTIRSSILGNINFLIVLTNVCYTGSVMILTTNIFWNRKRIQHLLRDLISDLSDKEKSHIKKCSFVFIIPYVVSVILIEVGYGSIINKQMAGIYEVYGNPPASMTWLVDIVNCWEWILMAWPGSPISVYVFMTYTRYKMTVNQVKSMRRSVKVSKSRFEGINRIRFLKEEFESLFSFIPGLLLMYLLVEVTGHWFVFRSGVFMKSEISPLLLVTNVLMIIFNCGMPLFMILFAENLQSKIRAEADSLISEIQLSHPNPNSMALFIQELRLVSQDSLTVLGLFPINNTLILSFISTLMTFTVLFIRMVEKKI